MSIKDQSTWYTHCFSRNCVIYPLLGSCRKSLWPSSSQVFRGLCKTSGGFRSFLVLKVFRVNSIIPSNSTLKSKCYRTRRETHMLQNLHYSCIYQHKISLEVVQFIFTSMKTNCRHVSPCVHAQKSIPSIKAAIESSLPRNRLKFEYCMSKVLQ